MPFVSRDDNGRINGVFDKPTPRARERVSGENAELRDFLQGAGAQSLRHRLGATDPEMARITEDLIDLLITKNLINFTDFPPEAQEKLINRRRLRRNLSSLSNLVGDQDDIL